MTPVKGGHLTAEHRANISAGVQRAFQDPAVRAKLSHPHDRGWPAEARVASMTSEANESRKASLRTYHEGRWVKRLTTDGRLLCSKCGEPSELAAYRVRGGRPTGACKTCKAALPSNTADARRGKHLRARYGIDLTAYEALLAAQGGVCAICGGGPVGQPYFYVDHDHVTGRIRGLLCLHCNTFLGNAKDSIPNLIAAIAYLDAASREED